MRSLTSTAIVAIVAGTIGFATLTPAAFAQQGPNPGQQPSGDQMQMHDQMQMPGQFGNHRNHNNGNNNGVRPGALLDLVCNDNGAERTELGFVRLSYKLDLTAEQKTLFDDLRTSALTAQTQFADQCSKPGAPAADAIAANAQPVPPTPVERLTAQIGNDTVRLELMQGLLPKLDAFYKSLTDEQKATLAPQRDADNGNGFHRRHRGNMPGMEMPGQPGDMPAPGQMPAPPQPNDPAAPAPTQG